VPASEDGCEGGGRRGRGGRLCPDDPAGVLQCAGGCGAPPRGAAEKEGERQGDVREKRVLSRLRNFFAFGAG